MTVNEIIKLLDAGYTRDEIQKMEEPKPEVKPEEKQEVKPEEKQEVKPEEKADPVLAELQKLTKAVYAMNVMSSEQPKQKSADDALAELMKGM
jgi:wobble nucleotide-excising tRNase